MRGIEGEANKMFLSHAILAFTWILFCILHSIFASTPFKKWAQKKLKENFKYLRLYYTLFALVSFIAVMAFLIFLPSKKLFQPTLSTEIVGIIITSAGFIIMSLCIYKYFFQLSGLKSLVKETKGNELMITGIHKYVRHPLYTGTFIFIWGLLILFPTYALLVVDVIIKVYTLIGIHLEEQKLILEFGEKYLEYKKKVPMIIPRF